jgi:hypothetical protein
MDKEKDKLGHMIELLSPPTPKKISSITKKANSIIKITIACPLGKPMNKNI